MPITFQNSAETSLGFIDLYCNTQEKTSLALKITKKKYITKS